MIRRTRPRIVIALVAAAALSTGALSRAAGDAAVATQTYVDALGDATCCVDIGAVTVSNDPAGLLTFRIELPNQPVAEPGRLTAIWIDPDLDPLTGVGLPGAPAGRSRGGDYSIRLDAGGDPIAALIRYPTTFLSPVFVGAVDATYDRGWTVTVDRRLLGGPATFDFYVAGLRYETDRPELVDDAPDFTSGQWGWRYDTGLPPLVAKPTVTVGRATLAPNPPRAGRPLVMRLPFTTAPAGTRAAVRCSATAAGTPLRKAAGGNSIANGAAVCAWAVPRSARGKLLRASVTVTAGSAAVTRRFSGRAR